MEWLCFTVNACQTFFQSGSRILNHHEPRMRDVMAPHPCQNYTVLVFFCFCCLCLCMGVYVCVFVCVHMCMHLCRSLVVSICIYMKTSDDESFFLGYYTCIYLIFWDAYVVCHYFYWIIFSCSRSPAYILDTRSLVDIVL